MDDIKLKTKKTPKSQFIIAPLVFNSFLTIWPAMYPLIVKYNIKTTAPKSVDFIKMIFKASAVLTRRRSDRVILGGEKNVDI
jgi:hypothetical protein